MGGERTRMLYMSAETILDLQLGELVVYKIMHLHGKQLECPRANSGDLNNSSSLRHEETRGDKKKWLRTNRPIVNSIISLEIPQIRVPRAVAVNAI